MNVEFYGDIPLPSSCKINYVNICLNIIYGEIRLVLVCQLHDNHADT